MLENNQKESITIKGESRLPTLIGVLFLLSSFAIYNFFTSSLSEVYASKIELIENNTSELEGLNVRVESLEKAKLEIGQLSEVTGLDLDKKIPASLDQDQVIEDVVNISNNYGIKLRSISFGKGSVSQQGLASLRVNASFEGEYSDLVDFLKGVERNGRFFKVNSISVQVSQLTGSSVERVTFSLALEAFYRQDIATK